MLKKKVNSNVKEKCIYCKLVSKINGEMSMVQFNLTWIAKVSDEALW